MDCAKITREHPNAASLRFHRTHYSLIDASYGPFDVIARRPMAIHGNRIQNQSLLTTAKTTLRFSMQNILSIWWKLTDLCDLKIFGIFSLTLMLNMTLGDNFDFFNVLPRAIDGYNMNSLASPQSTTEWINFIAAVTHLPSTVPVGSRLSCLPGK